MLVNDLPNATSPCQEPFRDPPATRRLQLDRMRDRLQASGQWHDGQVGGRRWPIGCVSLEVTQRCNLDCTLCYLSDDAEALRDLPLEELLRRIDVVHAHYGVNTDIQISGGEPTLRPRHELAAVVRHIVMRGMRASLFTNGILATRELLLELAAAGLSDVAFHVDLTQQRPGYATEAALNALRRAYIDRARGLGLAVFFNTTVYQDNLVEVPQLARFFAEHADVVSLASFQLQADTGRGVLRQRAAVVTQATVIDAIRDGVGVALDFDAVAGGHVHCNRYALGWVAAGRVVDALADRKFARRVMRETAALILPRGDRGRAVAAILAGVAARPRLWVGALRYVANRAWALRRELWSVRGRLRKISFFVHNFMDASGLDEERLQACVFMAATVDGPMPMCAYNAQRDSYLGRTITLADGSSWQPKRPTDIHVIPLKRLRGRLREAAMAQRALGTLPVQGKRASHSTVNMGDA